MSFFAKILQLNIGILSSSSMLVAMSMTRSADNGSQYHIIGIDSKFQRANQYLSILMLYCIENYAFNFPSPHIHLFKCLHGSRYRVAQHENPFVHFVYHVQGLIWAYLLRNSSIFVWDLWFFMSGDRGKFPYCSLARPYYSENAIVNTYCKKIGTRFVFWCMI